MNSLDRSASGVTPTVLVSSAVAWLVAVAWASLSGTLVALSHAFVPSFGLLTTMPMAAVNRWWVGLLFSSHVIVLTRLTAKEVRS